MDDDASDFVEINELASALRLWKAKATEVAAQQAAATQLAAALAQRATLLSDAAATVLRWEKAAAELELCRSTTSPEARLCVMLADSNVQPDDFRARFGLATGGATSLLLRSKTSTTLARSATRRPLTDSSSGSLDVDAPEQRRVGRSQPVTKAEVRRCTAPCRPADTPLQKLAAHTTSAPHPSSVP